MRILLHDEVLTFEEIVRLAKIFRGHGVEKIRLTGGEPLLRHGIEGLVEMLARALPGVDLTHQPWASQLVRRNFIGEIAALTGRVRGVFLAKRLDRNDRQAGPKSRPEESQPALATAIHPG